jgi:hypothetical protein
MIMSNLAWIMCFDHPQVTTEDSNRAHSRFSLGSATAHITVGLGGNVAIAHRRGPLQRAAAYFSADLNNLTPGSGFVF